MSAITIRKNSDFQIAVARCLMIFDAHWKQVNFSEIPELYQRAVARLVELDFTEARLPIELSIDGRKIRTEWHVRGNYPIALNRQVTLFARHNGGKVGRDTELRRTFTAIRLTTIGLDAKREITTKEKWLDGRTGVPADWWNAVTGGTNGDEPFRAVGEGQARIVSEDAAEVKVYTDPQVLAALNEIASNTRDTAIGITKIAAPTMRSASEHTEDGPIPPKSFRYNGRQVDDVEPVPWKLIDYLWQRKRAKVADAEQAVWGDESENDSRLKSAISRANISLMEAGCAFRISRSGDWLTLM